MALHEKAAIPAPRDFSKKLVTTKDDSQSMSHAQLSSYPSPNAHSHLPLQIDDLFQKTALRKTLPPIG